MTTETPQKSGTYSRTNVRSSTKKKRDETDELLCSNKKKIKSNSHGSKGLNSVTTSEKQLPTRVPHSNVVLPQDLTKQLANEYNDNTLINTSNKQHGKLDERSTDVSQSSDDASSLVKTTSQKDSDTDGNINKKTVDNSEDNVSIESLQQTHTNDNPLECNEDTPVSEEIDESSPPEESTESTPDSLENHVDNDIKETILAQTMKNISIVHVYSNQEQQVRVYASVGFVPNETPLQFSISKLKVCSPDNFTKRRFKLLRSNEVENLAKGLEGMEVKNTLVSNCKVSDSSPLPPGDYFYLSTTPTLTHLIETNIKDVINLKCVVTLENYVNSLKEGKKPVNFVPAEKNSRTDHEKRFNALGYALNLVQVAKGISNAHFDLYDKLFKDYPDLIVSQCLLHFSASKLSCAAIAKKLSKLNPSWNRKFIIRTIWTVHYNAVNQSRELTTGNLCNNAFYQNHIMLLDSHKRTVVPSKKLRQAITGLSQVERQRGPILKASRIRERIVINDPALYENKKTGSEEDLKKVFKEFAEKSEKHLKDMESKISLNTHLVDELNKMQKENNNMKVKLELCELKIENFMKVFKSLKSLCK